MKTIGLTGGMSCLDAVVPAEEERKDLAVSASIVERGHSSVDGVFFKTLHGFL